METEINKNSKTLKFEDIPNAISELKKGLNELKTLLIENTNNKPDIETPIQLNEAVIFTGLTKATLYRYVRQKEIPHYKKGNRLYFFKSEISDWIKIGVSETTLYREKLNRIINQTN